MMIAFADSPPRIAARHRRWSAAGHGTARTTATRSGDLMLSVRMDSVKRSTRNTRQRQCLSRISFSRRLNIVKSSDT